MLARAVLHHFWQAALLIVIGIILVGNVPSEDVIRLVLALGVGRFIFLIIEALPRPVSEDDWAARPAELARHHQRLSEPEFRSIADGPRTDPRPVTAEEIANAEIASARAQYRPPRPRLELLAEAAGFVGFALLIPADIGMIASPLFSFHRPQEAAGVLALAVCLALYGLPLIRRFIFRRSLIRTLWWAAPFFPALLVLVLLVATKHPYLNPLDPEHHRLAAERIVATAQLGNNVVAASHADWLFRYAHDLETLGAKEEAIKWYQRGLQLDADQRGERARLADLLPPEESAAALPSVDPYAPLWPDAVTFPEVPRCRIDSSLSVNACTIVIVPVGDIPEVVIAAVAYAIHHELDLPVLTADVPMKLSAADRTHGLLVGQQWNVETLGDRFCAAFPLPAAPIKYPLLTDQDIYMPGANYVFSASFSWGAIVSAARFITFWPDERDLIVARTTKQSLAAVIKSFGVPVSTDRACVTSYVRSPDEFDRKGNRPTADTLALLREAVIDWNRTWPESRPASAPELETLHQQLEQLAAPRP